MATVAGDRWRAALAAWAIPEPIRAAAVDDPFAIRPALFHPDALAPAAVSVTRAREALPAGGSVLDVGCGGGAASLALVPGAGSITGVDADPAMLATFEQLCRERLAPDRPAPGRAVLGRWPDVAEVVPAHDVVVCHHVVYNVAAIEDFLLALTARTRRRVVLEVTRHHPQAALDELWWHFHQVRRPTDPGVGDLIAVLRELGLDARVEEAERPAVARPREVLVDFARRRLCLPPSADAEVDRLLPADHCVPPAQVACVWWDAA
jgi:SAM-dependent methyltransferase